MIDATAYPDKSTVLGRPGHRLPRARSLQLYAAGCRYLQTRRRRLRLPVRPRLPRADDAPAATTPTSCHPPPRRDERRHRRPSRRSDRIDPHVPRQLPESMGGQRRLRADRRTRSSVASTSMPSSSSSTVSAPVDSNRCVIWRRARPRCSGLVTSKTPELESQRRPARRIDEASASSYRSSSWR